MTFERYKVLLGNRNKNHKVVKIRSMRSCAKCGSSLPVGTECLTVNPKMRDRFWICQACVCRLLDVCEAQVRLNLVPFGDEGGYLANQNALDEALTEFIYNGTD